MAAVHLPILFEKLRFCVRIADRRTNRQTSRWTEPMRKGAVASGALILVVHKFVRCAASALTEVNV